MMSTILDMCGCADCLGCVIICTCIFDGGGIPNKYTCTVLVLEGAVS